MRDCKAIISFSVTNAPVLMWMNVQLTRVGVTKHVRTEWEAMFVDVTRDTCYVMDSFAMVRTGWAAIYVGVTRDTYILYDGQF